MILVDRPALAPLTTLRLGGNAIAEVRLERMEDILILPETLKRLGGFPHILGGGSNLLIQDGELPIVVLRPLMGTHDEPKVLRQGDADEGMTDRIFLRVGAGMRIPHLLNWCIRHGLAGLEGLAGIPGRMGGAIAMNAGAYGCSIAPLVRSLTVFTPERGTHILSPEEWEFTYRRFILREKSSWFIILSAVLALCVSTPEKVRAVYKKNFLCKKACQPVHEYTAGCVFKNPEGYSAGRLLDIAGMKGVRRGSLFFSHMHANFLVHDKHSRTKGTYEDALELLEMAQTRVKEQFGIPLEKEVRLWPCLS